jgi:protein arginine kinase activator
MPTPFRKCDHCANPAVVHHTVITDGKTARVHLCEAHAAELGVSADAHAPIAQLLGQLAQAGASRARGPACPHCGHTFNDFKSNGLLGCAGCYEAFAATVAPVIDRAQAGGSRHVGRAPAAAAGARERAEELRKLSRELEQAVAAEQYEQAARLRDRIRGLREGAVPGAAGKDGQ